MPHRSPQSSPRYNSWRETQCISYRSPQSYPKVKYLKRNIIHILGLRLWTTVRYVLCFSSAILPWATTVDFGGVCIVFFFRYFTLGYEGEIPEEKHNTYPTEVHSRSPRYNTWRETQYISYRSPQSYPKVKYLKRNIIHTWQKSTIVAQVKSGLR
jgi:hypothetical protein